MEPIDIVYVGPNLLDREINTFKGDYFCIEEIKGNQADRKLIEMIN